MIFEIIETITYGDLAGYAINWIAAAVIFIFIFDQFLSLTKIKKIK
jgi:hypothetical protein